MAVLVPEGRRVDRTESATARVAAHPLYNRLVDSLDRGEVIEVLRAHRDTLAERFGVTRLALFGSFARDQATEASDVDVLVGFDGPATSRSYFGVQFYLEDLLGRRVDLVTVKALRARFRPYVEREAVHV